MSKYNSRNVLITGAASGIGRAACDKFLAEGHRVYAVDIKPTEEREGLVSLIADVTSEEDVRGISDRLSAEGVTLDAILCIAGVHAMASLVEEDFSGMERLMDINLLGTMRIVRQLHPMLSAHGRIVIVTSEVASLAPMPFNGLYSVSKTALDCYAQALRQELNLIGQSVVTVRPGAVSTPLADGSVRAVAELAERTQLYRGQAERFSSIAAKFMGTPIKAEALGNLLYKATVTARPRAVYSKHRNPGLVLLSLLPLKLQCLVIKLILGKSRKIEKDGRK